MEDLSAVRGWLAAAHRVVVLTGAGISTDSGLPDFRGPQGVWTKDPAAERASHISHYLADPALRERAWRRRVEAAPTELQPNPGHRALVALEHSGRLLALLTQNVDGLHHAAGSDPSLVVEVHGTARECACLACGERQPIDAVLERVRGGEADPPCLRCGGILKTATVSFGQSLAVADLQRADVVARSCDLLLAVGTTLAVHPIADVVPLAAASGARVVIVNGSATEMDDLADAVLTGSISELLPALVTDLPPMG